MAASESAPPAPLKIGWLRLRRRRRQAERALAEGDAQAARELFQDLARARPGDFYLWAQLARAASEEADWSLAFEAAQQALQLGRGSDGAAILQAEVCMAAGKYSEAWTELHRCPENLVASALILLLEFFAPAPPGRHAPVPSSPAVISLRPPRALPPHALWFGPVLAHLLFFLEKKLSELPDSPEVHRARAALFLPDLRPEAFPPPPNGLWSRITAACSSARKRERRRREEEVLALLRRGELPQAGEKLAAWLDDEPEAFGKNKGGPSADPRFGLLIDLLFASGEFQEVLKLGEPVLKEGTVLDPSLALYITYANLALGRLERAREILHRRVKAPSGLTAETCHLYGLLSVQSGHPEKAIPWFRRAFERNDLALVEAARRQMEALGRSLPAASKCQNGRSLRLPT
ncbi:MAG: hypothetical protein HY717_23275 [Planctomycetes bacterium]|nr:hypothetical protein [Planctomycetota bacterium]